MKKIALVLSIIMMFGLASVSVYAEDTVTTTGTEQSAGNNGGLTGAELTAVVTCMQTAVETRDTAILAAFDTYATTVKSALTARKDALKAAWAITDRKERRTAIMTAWKNYKTAIKDARVALKTAKKTAWDAFKAASKVCKPTKTQDNSNQSVDNSL
jgi:hypothetical protein